MTAAILHLPPELLEHILELLVTDDIRALRALLYTCKVLYKLALPFSVRSFVNWRPDIEYDSVLLADCEQPRRILGFLRYVAVTKPFLARQVRSIGTIAVSTHETVGDGSYDEPPPRGDNIYSLEEQQVYKNLIDSVINISPSRGARTWRKEWLADLDNGLEDAQLAVLLVACENVTCLSLACSAERRVLPRLVRFAVARAQEAHDGQVGSGGPRPLGRLAEFNQESTDTEYGYGNFEAEAAPLFTLPSLRVYEGILLMAEATVWEEFSKIHPRSSNVEHLVLRHSDFKSPRDLERMVLACKALRTLEYSLGRYWADDDEQLLPRHIADMVLQHANTLETLLVYYALDSDLIGPPRLECMGAALKRMAALKTLVIGMMDIIGIANGDSIGQHAARFLEGTEDSPRLIDCIPETLERLDIRGCGTALLDHAQELLDGLVSGRLPRLKHVRFLFMAEKLSDPKAVIKALSWDPQRVVVDIELQTYDDIAFDEDEQYNMTDDRRCGVRNLEGANQATRVYDPTGEARRVWLAKRGYGTWGEKGYNEPRKEWCHQPREDWRYV